MAITAEDLYRQSEVRPSDFGKDIVPPRGTEDEKRALAVDHIEKKVLPLAIAEVEVPYLKASGGYSIPLPDAIVLARYPKMNPAGILSINAQLASLYDAAVLSYGRSEINKQINTNAAEYDKDSDQDRIQGNQRLEKLLCFITDLRAQSPMAGASNRSLQTMTAPTSFTF